MGALMPVLVRAAAALGDPSVCAVEAALSRARVFSSDLEQTSANFKRQKYARRYTDVQGASVSSHIVRLQGQTVQSTAKLPLISLDCSQLGRACDRACKRRRLC